MSQGTYGELERSGKKGSSYTVQLAAFFGVSAEWLATGKGDMVPAELANSGDQAEPNHNVKPLRYLTIDELRKTFAERLAAMHPENEKLQRSLLDNEVWQIREPEQATGTYAGQPRRPGKK